MAENFERITLSITKDLKARMDGYKANWSAIARDAFERKIAEMSEHKPNQPASVAVLTDLFPQMGQLDKVKLERNRHTAIRFAPTVMKDPLVLGSWIMSTTQMGYVDVAAVRLLLEAEKLHRELIALHLNA